MNTELFHSLEGEKIYFKKLDPNEAEAVHEYASDKETKRFIGWRLMNKVEETRSFIEEMIRREEAETHLYASVVLKTTGKVIGTVMIFAFDKEANQAEVGYVFNKQYWGKGYGTEAVALMTNYAKEELKLHRLNANVVAENYGSARILEKSAFEIEGRLRDYYFIEGRYYNRLILGKILE